MSAEQTTDGAVAALAEMADKAAELAREMHRLTGEYDPLLTDVQIQTGCGAWRSLGPMRLSDIGHLRVVRYDFDAIPDRSL